MYNQDIIDSNNKIKTCVDIRNKMILSDFFTEDKMRRLLDIIKEENNMTNYISTEYIGDRMIRMSLRQNYFKKFNYSTDPLDYYRIVTVAIDRWIDEYLPEITNLFMDDISCINQIRENSSLLYNIIRPAAGIIVISF